MVSFLEFSIFSPVFPSSFVKDHLNANVTCFIFITTHSKPPATPPLTSCPQSRMPTHHLASLLLWTSPLCSESSFMYLKCASFCRIWPVYFHTLMLKMTDLSCVLTGMVTVGCTASTHFINNLFVTTDMEFSSAPVTVRPSGPILPPVLIPTPSPSSGPGPELYGSGIVLQDDPATSTSLEYIPGGHEGKAHREAASVLH